MNRSIHYNATLFDIVLIPKSEVRIPEEQLLWVRSFSRSPYTKSPYKGPIQRTHGRSLFLRAGSSPFPQPRYMPNALFRGFRAFPIVIITPTVITRYHLKRLLLFLVLTILLTESVGLESEGFHRSPALWGGLDSIFIFLLEWRYVWFGLSSPRRPPLLPIRLLFQLSYKPINLQHGWFFLTHARLPFICLWTSSHSIYASTVFIFCTSSRYYQYILKVNINGCIPNNRLLRDTSLPSQTYSFSSLLWLTTNSGSRDQRCIYLLEGRVKLLIFRLLLAIWGS